MYQDANKMFQLNSMQSDFSLNRVKEKFTTLFCCRCWIFRSWGRVGTTIGGNKIEQCGSKNSALTKFKDLYAEKTGNFWEDRKDFKKIPNKFYPLDIDYGAVSNISKEFLKTFK